MNHNQGILLISMLLHLNVNGDRLFDECNTFHEILSKFEFDMIKLDLVKNGSKFTFNIFIQSY